MQFPRIGTEADFETMNWHDARIHALALLPETLEIAFDIDFITRWVEPERGATNYQFWVAPATLVFANAYDIELDVNAPDGKLTIMQIRRGDDRTPRNAQFVGKDREWLWIVECLNGEIRFRSCGFKQYLRSEPKLSRQQVLNAATRKTSFERPIIYSPSL